MLQTAFEIQLAGLENEGNGLRSKTTFEYLRERPPRRYPREVVEDKGVYPPHQYQPKVMGALGPFEEYIMHWSDLDHLRRMA